MSSSLYYNLQNDALVANNYFYESSSVYNCEVSTGGIIKLKGQIIENNETIGAVATDTFVRANANPMTTNCSDGVSIWFPGPGTWTNPQINNNNCIVGTGGGDCGAMILSPIFSADQISTFTRVSTAEYQGPLVRVQSSTTGSCYAAYTLGSSVNVNISKVTDNEIALTFVPLGATPIVINEIFTGDTIGLSATGTSPVTLTLYHNGVMVTTRTDSNSPWTTGQPGMILDGGGARLSKFTANDLGGTTGSFTKMIRMHQNGDITSRFFIENGVVG